MTFSSYPTAEHIEAELKSNSIWPTDPDKQTQARYVAGIVAQAGAAEWERLVGWNPFLAGWSEEGINLTPTTRTFTVVEADGLLDFKGAAQSIVAVQDGPYPLSPDTGYRPNKLNAGSPSITGVLLRPGRRLCGPFELGFTVMAVWGRVAAIPADVFLALLKREMATMMDLVENLQSIASISQDGFSKDYDIVGVRTQKDIAETGDKDFLITAERWKRVIT